MTSLQTFSLLLAKQISLSLSAHPFKDAADGVGHQRTPALHQQVEHHRQQLLLHLLVSEGREERLRDLQRVDRHVSNADNIHLNLKTSSPGSWILKSRTLNPVLCLNPGFKPDLHTSLTSGLSAGLTLLSSLVLTQVLCPVSNTALTLISTLVFSTASVRPVPEQRSGSWRCQGVAGSGSSKLG